MTDIPSAQARAGNSTTLTKREALRDRLGRDAFISLFLASNEFNEQIERACRAEGISHPQYVVLWVLCLADAREGLPMGALAEDVYKRQTSFNSSMVSLGRRMNSQRRRPGPPETTVVGRDGSQIW